MACWIRFEQDGAAKFGTVEGDGVAVWQGDMFDHPQPTAEQVGLEAVKLLTPTVPRKMICLWNNSRLLADKLNLTPPQEPLYFLKAGTAFAPGDSTIRKPPSYEGKVVFEGELGIVIGKECCAVPEETAAAHIFGYTCVNDVTAIELLHKDKSFAQWTRAKSFDTFGVFGPVVVTGLEPDGLVVRSVLDGAERQNYPVSDLFFHPYRLVSMISADMRLLPGDVIACGTSVGVGSMKPGSTIEIFIEGIGTLRNRYE